MSIENSHGVYLSPIGSKAVLKSRSQSVTRDELFSLEDSSPQASFVAGLNMKYVSVKQGVDVTANQDEIGQDETFQMGMNQARFYLPHIQLNQVFFYYYN